MSAIREMIDRMYGPANKDMQTLLLAAEKAAKTYGKRSLFGADKHAPALQAFEDCFTSLLGALARQGLAEPTLVSTTKAAESMFAMYRIGYPNWPRAYDVCEAYLGNLKSRASEADLAEAKRKEERI